MPLCKRLTSYLLLALLSACQGFSASTDTLGFAFSSFLNSNNALYVPGFEYLEIEYEGKKTLLALGHRKVEGDDVEEQWYSGVGEMLSLRNGRLQEVMGMTSEVRQTSRNIPKWEQLQANRSSLTWMRTRNLHPGYRYGVNEFVTSEAHVSKQSDLEKNQTWVYESVLGQLANGREWRYQEKFQLENGRVVRSEQCVAQHLCFKIKPLGVMVSK